MLVIFAPQVVFYGLGLVSSAALQAQGRFVAAAVAPAVNNVVVIGCYLAFDALRGDTAPSLDLTTTELLVLAAAAPRSPSSPSPRCRSWHCCGRPPSASRSACRSPTRPSSESVSTGSWAVVQVAGVLALTAAGLVIGNGAPGGVAVYALATAVALLPYALVAGPVATAALPRLASMHQDGDETGFRSLVVQSATRVLALGSAAAIGLFVLACRSPASW